MHIVRKSMTTKRWFFIEPAAYGVRNTNYLFLFTFLLTATALRAQTWNDGVGDWFTPTNWTPNTVPTPNSVVTIANGGTAQVAEGTANAGDLTVGSTSTVAVGVAAFLEVNRTVVNSGNIIGSSNGVSLLATVTVTNNAGASIQGSLSAPVQFPFYGGVTVSTGAVTNAGLISGENGIVFLGAGSVTNKAGGTIQGIAQNDNGFDSNTGAGIYAFVSPSLVTVVNEAGATIKGVGTFSWGIHTGITPMNITNFGVISGAIGAINVNGGGTFINEAGAFITSTTFQPLAVTNGTENIINFGTISSSSGGIGFGPPGGGGTVTNNVGGVISGTGSGSFGIASGSTNQSVAVINSGVISGSSGIDLGTGGGSITNNATGSITGFANSAVNLASGGTTTIVNSGTISSASGNAIHFAGSASGSVTNNPGGVLAGGSGNSAILSGTGAISILNAGTINGAVNPGNAPNTVTLVTGGRINGNLNLGSDAASSLVLDGSGQEAISHAVTGSITNSGSLTKQGTGTWILDEGLSAPISTNVLAGALVVDSTLNTPVVNVHAGGTLAGFGTITGSVINSGIVAPGALQLSGNYTQNAGGTLLIGIAGLAPGQHGLLAVGGHASLAGTLQLIGLGGFTLHAGDQLTFLTASGGVSGSFGTVRNAVATGTLVQGIITTSANAIVLEGQQGSFTQIPGVTLTPNQLAVGKMLNSAVGNPAAAALFAFLNSQPVGNLQNDYNLIAPT